MNLEEKVKQGLLIRGFSKEKILNNRGLIGAAIDESVLIIVKNLAINDNINNKVLCCGNCHLPLHDIEYVPKVRIADKKYNID